jgi:hypothetical protein
MFDPPVPMCRLSPRTERPRCSGTWPMPPRRNRCKSGTTRWFSGEGGIRTLGRPCGRRRFSSPPRSAPKRSWSQAETPGGRPGERKPGDRAAGFRATARRSTRRDPRRGRGSRAGSRAAPRRSRPAARSRRRPPQSQAPGARRARPLVLACGSVESAAAIAPPSLCRPAPTLAQRRCNGASARCSANPTKGANLKIPVSDLKRTHRVTWAERLHIEAEYLGTVARGA